MDCELAREQLDAARPDTGDREDSALEAAFAHADACPACAEVVEFRREFDRQAGRVIRDVPVPAGLKERLLAAAEISAQPSVVRAPADQRSARYSRRKVFVAVTSAAALLLAAAGTWLFTHDAPAPLAMSDVQAFWASRIEHGAALADLPEFDGSFDPAIQDGRWSGAISASPLGADMDDDGRHDAAVYAFRTGFLVIMQPGRVTGPPEAGSALSAQRSYRPVPNVAWTLDGQVYLCYVEQGGPPALEQVLSHIYDAQA